MRRRLVIHDERARHPIRQMVYPDAPPMPVRGGQKQLKWWKREDTHLFVISFSAFFTVFYTFLA